MSMNSCCFTGRLGKDPETKFTNSGKALTSFSLAVDNGYGDKKTVIWLKVTAFDKTGEAAGKYLVKGSECAVSGRVQLNEWEGKDGVKHSQLELVARDVVFIGAKAEGTGKSSGKPAEIVDDDIPF